jgi:tricarballylate dehydrogenase
VKRSERYHHARSSARDEPRDVSDRAAVVVIGAGNAAFSAALSARENGARVVVLEKAAPHEAHGNSRFTAGSMRFAYDGIDDLRALMPDLGEAEIANTDFGSYPVERYRHDINRLNDDRSDAELVDILVTRSKATLLWMREQGVRFVPQYASQSIRANGRVTFFGGSTVEVAGGGPALIDAWRQAASRAGVEIRYGAAAERLLHDAAGVHGVRASVNGHPLEIAAGAVILASGGFEANAAWRARHLGANWERAKVRGTRHNTGDGIRMALEIGAAPYGRWSGCHAVGWDRDAPAYGDLTVGNRFQKHSYPFGISLNAHGERFVDEGSEFRNYTYANYGRAVLEQPGQCAWQVFDGKTLDLLRDEYRISRVAKVVAASLGELVAKLDGVAAERALETIRQFNAAVQVDVPFDPSREDGRAALGLAIPKSNWATTIDTPPFEAYAVTCGITFTYGGLRIDRMAQVLDESARPIAGLYATGELIGGLFHTNYPGGAGLMAGAVFGRIAGASAAVRCAQLDVRSRAP